MTFNRVCIFLHKANLERGPLKSSLAYAISCHLTVCPGAVASSVDLHVKISQKSFEMPRHCVMIKCGNEPNKEEDLCVHKFPADSDRRKGWTKVVQIARADFREPSPGNKNVGICSEHFRDDD